MYEDKIKKIFTNFSTDGDFFRCTVYGNGHINDTRLAEYKQGEKINKYILQAINSNVFPRPKEVIENIKNVLDYLKSQGTDKRKMLHFVPATDGSCYYEDDDGRIWRMYEFVENSVCLELPETSDDFYESAFAFGEFQSSLSDFPAEKLYETLKDFHNTPKRYKDFLSAVENDVCGRAKTCSEEIEYVNSQENFYSVLFDANKRGELPLRVTHNDTKMNNVMLDAETRKALCVIDLDTIMPGFSVTDFGDAIRFGASTAVEDEKDLRKVSLNLELFEVFTKGFLKGCNGRLTEKEIMLLPEGAKMMTLECGMRFLTDYLSGDTYFKTDYPEHNLVRCRTQFTLARDMDCKWVDMKNIVKKYI